MSNEVVYRTRDLYYAAYLMTVGEQMGKLSLVGKSVYMEFGASTTMPKRAQEYHCKRGPVDAISYADNVKSLKSMCVSMVRGEAMAQKPERT